MGKNEVEELLKQKSPHWLDAGPEEMPLACPDCHEAFGHIGLLDGFDLSKEEIERAVEADRMDETREHIPPIVVTCPHCKVEHDVNMMGIWMFLLLCLWETMLDMRAIKVDGGFAAFVKGESEETTEEHEKARNTRLD